MRECTALAYACSNFPVQSADPRLMTQPACHMSPITAEERCSSDAKQISISVPTCRTTGEFAAMTLAERKRALELARDSWQGVILNNISTCCMEDSMQLLEHSAEQVTTPEVGPPMHSMQFLYSAVLAGMLEQHAHAHIPKL